VEHWQSNSPLMMTQVQQVTQSRFPMNRELQCV